MIPAPRLRLKRSTGWFAAGQEVATALPLLSDAAFKLYVFLCLNVNRHSARMVWEPMELANLLQRDRQSVTDALEELCRREVCIRRPAADGRIALDRLSVEICDRFWPYEKPPVEEFGIDQNSYVQRVRQMLSGPACVRVNFSAADERLAAILLSARGHAGTSPPGHLARLCPQVRGVVERERRRSHARHQPELLLRSCECGRRDVGGRRLLGAHAEQSEPTGKDVAGSNSGPGVIQTKRRNEGNEIMLILPRNIQAHLLAAPGHAYNLFTLGEISTGGNWGIFNRR
jgi:hypothetical protein